MVGVIESEIYVYVEKMVIVCKVISFFCNGMYIFISGGIINLEVVCFLFFGFKVIFFIVSLFVVMQLAWYSDSEMFFIGGCILGDVQISIGGEVIKKLFSFSLDLCLFGANSIDFINGLMDSDWEVVEVKQVMCEVLG